MFFKIFTEVEDGELQIPPFAKEKWHHEATRPSVSIHEWMDRFKLIVNDGEACQWWQVVAVSDVGKEIPEEIADKFWWWRNETCRNEIHAADMDGDGA